MASEKIPYKIYLSEEEMPKTWYNVRADIEQDCTSAASRHRAADGVRGSAPGVL